MTEFIVQYYPKGNWRDWVSVKADTCGFIHDEGKPKIVIFSKTWTRGAVIDFERVVRIVSADEFGTKHSAFGPAKDISEAVK
jgi:hypothetical protein